jgi:hypothetical protein
MAGPGGKCSKADNKRKSPQNLKYKAERRHEKSHIRRITVHMARYGEADKTASEALKKYKLMAGVR